MTHKTYYLSSICEGLWDSIKFIWGNIGATHTSTTVNTKQDQELDEQSFRAVAIAIKKDQAFFKLTLITIM